MIMMYPLEWASHNNIAQEGVSCSLGLARTRVFVTTQEVVVEPLHLTGVEMQFSRWQVQLLIGSQTSATGLGSARPATHNVRLFTRGDRKRTDVRLFRPSGNRLRKNTSGRRRRPRTITDLPRTVSQEFRSTELQFLRPAHAVQVVI